MRLSHVVIAALVVCLVATAWQLYDKSTQQLSTQQLFDLQRQCAAEAGRAFNELGYNKNFFPAVADIYGNRVQAADTYENHYSPSKNKCFVMIKRTGGESVEKWLFDANERRQYAHIFVYLDPKPKLCELTPVGTEPRNPNPFIIDPTSCNSEDEFNAFAATYMQ